ncbi:hypothetical protein HZS_1768 [Henneguya salminicola]|nr:hypothetical protein HZS_1768 [Henneguya salminicola]
MIQHRKHIAGDKTLLSSLANDSNASVPCLQEVSLYSSLHTCIRIIFNTTTLITCDYYETSINLYLDGTLQNQIVGLSSIKDTPTFGVIKILKIPIQICN